jgi:hypothetical protein
MIEMHLLKPDLLSVIPHWTPLLEGSVHINPDAAILSNSCQMGVGVVIRNHLSECLTACSELLNDVMTSEPVEALAVHHTISFVGDEGFGKIPVVLDYLLSSVSILWRLFKVLLAVIFQDIKSLVRTI